MKMIVSHQEGLDLLTWENYVRVPWVTDTPAPKTYYGAEYKGWLELNNSRIYVYARNI